jgi:pimeloyl-ACP methyl ester carboxylesterase
MATLQANGIQIAFEQQGAGKDVVLVTGVGYGGWFWRWLAPRLAERFRVTTFDNRGTGASDKPAGPYTVDMLAADTAGLLDALGIRGAAVLGHSLGGYIAQRLVAGRPELVERLILASTNFGGSKVIPITAEALQVMTDRRGEPLKLIRRGIAIAAAAGFAERQPETVQALVDYRLSGAVSPAAYSAQVMAGAGTAAWSDEQVEAHMGAIRVPTLILFGEEDKVVPPGNAALLAARLPGAQVRLLSGAGHIFPVEAPASAAEAIGDFLGDW